MKIFLINPPFIGEKKHKHAPLGLYYISNYLKGIANVTVFDCNVHDDDLFRVVEDINPDIIGISVLTPTVNSSINLLNSLKRNNSKCFFIAGGIHASFFPDEMIYAGFDLVIRGEGELTFYEIVSKFGMNEMYQIDGISFWNKSMKKIVHRKDRKRIENLDLLGFPKLTKKELDCYEYASIIASRGCAYQCYYCSSSYYWKRVVKVRSAENVLCEIKYYLDMGIKHIYFCDDNFFNNPSMVKELCEKIVKQKLEFKWNALIRLDLINDEILSLMKSAGCTCLSIGIECGSEKVLEREKKISINTLINRFLLIKKYNIHTRTTWMIGMGKNYEEEKKSLDLMKILMPNQISIHMLIPYPNTDAWKNPEKYNLVLDKEHINYDIFTTTYSPDLLKEIHYKHLSSKQVVSLITYFKTEMKNVGYSDICDQNRNEYKIIESFLDDDVIPMLF